MIKQISIQNFKSVKKLRLNLRIFNVFIGANGSGKSNILEAVALASAAATNKADGEFLASRGIRVTFPRFMCSAFKRETNNTGPTKGFTFVASPDEKLTIEPVEIKTGKGDIDLRISGDDEDVHCRLTANLDSNEPYSLWEDINIGSSVGALMKRLEAGDLDLDTEVTLSILKDWMASKVGSLARFMIYSPEITNLRKLQTETQINPLGINGEGLFAHLAVLERQNSKIFDQIQESLKIFDWFSGFGTKTRKSKRDDSLLLQDRYLPTTRQFDQRSANEGFLFLLFYFTLILSPDTPSFFAIDNIDAALNPKLCQEMIQQLIGLSAIHGKQIIITTHNPAVLDGLDLTDDRQCLSVISRGPDGGTRVRQVEPRPKLEDAPPVRLSEAFIRGYLGGLPKNF